METYSNSYDSETSSEQRRQVNFHLKIVKSKSSSSSESFEKISKHVDLLNTAVHISNLNARSLKRNGEKIYFNLPPNSKISSDEIRIGLKDVGCEKDHYYIATPINIEYGGFNTGNPYLKIETSRTVVQPYLCCRPCFWMCYERCCCIGCNYNNCGPEKPKGTLLDDDYWSCNGLFWTKNQVNTLHDRSCCCYEKNFSPIPEIKMTKNKLAKSNSKRLLRAINYACKAAQQNADIIIDKESSLFGIEDRHHGLLITPFIHGPIDDEVDIGTLYDRKNGPSLSMPCDFLYAPFKARIVLSNKHGAHLRLKGTYEWGYLI